ncbi:uncharacterized protein LOC111223364 [Seriola dumerili]|uniref:uncharacterized protein LOC111223364 n=1 Tax=Seriola dumerili TaxID=41447 RepID=UPI000BBE8566|nr:uncharacterized protein LOC111223364 [Seriola dumerili]
MAAERRAEREEFEESDNVFRTNSLIIIEEMLKLSNHTPEDSTMLVDEILHSIFFLGGINKPSYSPEDIMSDREMLNGLRELYPNPFLHYSSQLPERSPFSCVLDMIVRLIGQENENQIIERLQDIIRRMSRGRGQNLISFTICVSQKTEGPASERYYGVSMSTSGRLLGKIMVAASCLSAWDRHVADAVMTYYPGKKTKKSYFDGTIQLPESVRCQAFSLSTGDEMPPCRSCGNLFGLGTDEEEKWPCGNCAEVESLSNLLKKENEVKRQVQPTSQTWTDENRQTAIDNVRKHLKCYLRTEGFDWDQNFYTPQRIQILYYF